MPRCVLYELFLLKNKQISYYFVKIRVSSALLMTGMHLFSLLGYGLAMFVAYFWVPFYATSSNPIPKVFADLDWRSPAFTSYDCHEEWKLWWSLECRFCSSMLYEDANFSCTSCTHELQLKNTQLLTTNLWHISTKTLSTIKLIKIKISQMI